MEERSFKSMMISACGWLLKGLILAGIIVLFLVTVGIVDLRKLAPQRSTVTIGGGEPSKADKEKADEIQQALDSVDNSPHN